MAVTDPMINDSFMQELENVDVDNLWFQQDDSTWQTAKEINDLLKETFGEHVISRRWRLVWSPR